MGRNDNCRQLQNWRWINGNPNLGNQNINLYAREGQAQDPNNYVQHVHIEHLESDNAIYIQNDGNQNAAQEMSV